MPVPSYRVPVKVARGTYANLLANVASLEEGELCYANDQDAIYVVEGGVLTKAGAAGIIEWSLTSNGNTDYYFNGPGFAGTETDPDLYVVRGQEYKITNSMGAHPFQIQSTQGLGGTAYNDGIANNAVSNGSLEWEVRMDAPSVLYYQCTAHADMNGTIYVLDAGTDLTTSSIDDLSDVDTSTTTPTDGKALVWRNGEWVTGPVVGGVSYTEVAQSSNYTAPTGFSYWNDTFQAPAGVPLGSGDLSAGPRSSGIGEDNAYSLTTKSTGKWYWEVELTGFSSNTLLGIVSNPTASFPGASGTGGLGLYYNGNWFNDAAGSSTTNVSALALNDVVMFALDADAKKLWVGLNGTWENSGDPAAGTGEVASAWTASSDWYFACRCYDTNSSYELTVTENTNTVAIPYSIDNLDDVDTSTITPADGQALVWDNATSKWEPGEAGTGLPVAQDGEALIWQNGEWVAGPTIGGVDYLTVGDTDFNQVSLLIKADGTDGSTTFADSSSNALTVTGTGTAQISTAQSKFGGSSLYFPVGTDKVSVAQNSLLDFGSGAWTIEMWVYWTGGSGESPLVCNRGAWSSAALFLTIQANGIVRAVKTGAGYGATSAVSQNTWTHLAVSYDGTSLRFFYDGVLDATYVISGGWDFSDGGTDFGAMTQFGSNQFTGYMDDIRITKGVARYTSNFTPPGSLPTATQIPVQIPYSIDKLDDVDTSTIAPTDGQALVWDNTAGKWVPMDVAADLSTESIDALSDVTITSPTDNQILAYNSTSSAWENITGLNGAATLIVPAAVGYVDSVTAGSGTGVTWGAYNSSNGNIDVTFNTAQPDADYSVVTDNENNDDIYVSVFNKTTTGFTLSSYDINGNSISPAVHPYSFQVWGSDPTITVGGTGAAVLDDLSDVDTSTTTPTDGQALVWNAANSQWEPGTVASGGGLIGTAYREDTQTAASGVATFTGLGKSGQLVEVTSTLDAWISLYPTSAARTADNGRAYGTDPSPGSGVLAEFYVTAGSTILASPGTTYFNNDTTKTAALYAAVRDQAGAAVNSQVTVGAYATSDSLIGTRTSVVATTTSIADGVAANVTLTGTGASGRFIKVETDRAAWVTLYSTTAARTADAGRAETTDPAPGSGVLAEVITSGAETIQLTPVVGYFNDESTPAPELYAKVVNKSGAASTVEVTVTLVPHEY